MDPRPLNFIAEATGGRLQGGGGALVSRVCTDSRKAAPGDLFVALKGENFDAHEFVPDVAGKAPAAVLVREGYSHPCLQNCAAVFVRNTREALAKLAGSYRRDFTLPVVAVAGSNGKTTTKELAAAVLRQKFPTASSPASFNNDIGVPLSLLQIGSEHKAAVLEVGTNHPGELEPLLRLVAPGYSIITSIGREHMEHFGTVEQVAQEEGWAAELLPDHGKLFINGDTPLAAAIARRTGAAVVTVGRNPQNDWRVTAPRISKSGTAFDLETPAAGFNGAYQVPLFGLHQAVNAAFAVALGAELGLSREQVLQGLASCPPPALRLQVWEAGGVSVLDDSYNANTDSMIAALQTLREYPCQGRRVAVLGDMAEQGSHSENAHLEVGRNAAELGVDQLIAVGPMAVFIARGARQSGLHRVLEFAQVESAAGAVRGLVKSGDALLVKASRVMRLERVAQALREPDNQRRN